MRPLGRTGLQVNTLSFGCGAVGGLMVRGEPSEQTRAVARAIELGVTYFDTAPLYGDGESERNLGRALRELGHPDVIVGTKVKGPATVAESLDASLRRLGLDHVDLLQLHDPVDDAAHVLETVVPALEAARDSGKARHIGFTAIGERAADVMGAFETAQIPYNRLIPDPALLERAAETGTGAIGIRVLAGGALSGTARRHANASPTLEPIGSGPSFEADVERAAQLEDPTVEAALRFAAGHPAMSTILLGISNLEQLELAAAALDL